MWFDKAVQVIHVFQVFLSHLKVNFMVFKVLKVLPHCLQLQSENCWHMRYLYFDHTHSYTNLFLHKVQSDITLKQQRLNFKESADAQKCFSRLKMTRRKMTTYQDKGSKRQMNLSLILPYIYKRPIILSLTLKTISFHCLRSHDWHHCTE